MFLFKNVEVLNELFIRNKDMSMLLDEKDRDTLDNLIIEFSKDTNSNLLKTILGLQENEYSIEIIWQLHTKQIVDFTEFITCYKWDLDHIVKTLLCMSESKEKLCQEILTDLLGSLLILLSGEPNHKFDRHIQIIQQFLTQSSLIIVRNHDGWVYLKNLKSSSYLTKSTTQKIFKIILKNMLIADVNFHLNIAYEQYRLYKTPDSVHNMLKMFLDEINEDVIYILIQNVLTQHSEKANWKLILSLVSTFVKTKSHLCHMLKLKLEEFFNQTLSKSTTEKSFLMQKAALLIFRHCCLEIGLWSEYNRWYSSYKPNVDAAKVFYSLLTELLPIDLPAALAAHINTQPKLTESCGDVQSDYVKKAQAQLIKINHGEDYMGLFKNYDDCENRHESDIIKVLESFKSTGQVMRVVLEACVFRNKYFTGTFLKTLMNTQLVDDELRNSFIEKLNSMNKIPKNMYTKWKQEQHSIYFS
uniref:Fanconi anemia group A protein n=1 Tax=Schizaphis graminum TaxID=13262 RepID=A0A2S2NBR7_SCHGA